MSVNVEKMVYSIIGIVVFLLLAAALLPLLVDALGNISVLSIPLASLFSGTGIVATLVVIGIAWAVITTTMPKMHKK